MVLSNDETSMLSGSWDKTILDWDLNTGQTKRSFLGSGGQISAIEMRPMSNLPIPKQRVEPIPTPLLNGGTFTANVEIKPNGVKADASSDKPGTPSDSLFGGNEDNDSLFGDDDGGAGGDMNFTQDDDDDSFAKAMRSDIQGQQSIEVDGDLDMPDQSQPTNDPAVVEAPSSPNLLKPKTPPETITNGLPHSEDISEPQQNSTEDTADADTDLPSGPETTFLDASIDGTIRIWDRRMSNPVARIAPPRSVPPWCMHACWSPDGNFIYAGRRNGTVDEYSLHKGLHEPRRSLRFPAGSGAVSAVRAMPNGRHLVW